GVIIIFELNPYQTPSTCNEHEQASNLYLNFNNNMAGQRLH
ncbi:MAG: hypothetical protein ACI854_002724, partial [Arenicella sp.]